MTIICQCYTFTFTWALHCRCAWTYWQLLTFRPFTTQLCQCVTKLIKCLTDKLFMMYQCPVMTWDQRTPVQPTIENVSVTVFYPINVTLNRNARYKVYVFFYETKNWNVRLTQSSEQKSARVWPHWFKFWLSYAWVWNSVKEWQQIGNAILSKSAERNSQSVSPKFVNVEYITQNNATVQLRDRIQVTFDCKNSNKFVKVSVWPNVCPSDQHTDDNFYVPGHVPSKVTTEDNVCTEFVSDRVWPRFWKGQTNSKLTKYNHPSADYTV